MKRSLSEIQREIIEQVLIIELCFNICSSIKIIPGRGSDFLPYYYNLNYNKGVISLHGLLASTQKDELSFTNYIKEYREIYTNEDIASFEKSILSISYSFKKLLPFYLRHKIAHLDQSFKHFHFTSAYILPSLIPKYNNIIKELKIVFFIFCKYSNDIRFQKIKDQSDLILKALEEL